MKLVLKSFRDWFLPSLEFPDQAKVILGNVLIVESINLHIHNQYLIFQPLDRPFVGIFHPKLDWLVVSDSQMYDERVGSNAPSGGNISFVAIEPFQVFQL